MELIKRVTKKSLFAVVPLSLLAFVTGWKGEPLPSKILAVFGNPVLLPLSIFLGGVMGVLNLRGLAWGIESLLGAQKATTKLVFMSIFRLIVFFTIIVILAVFKLINLLGLLIGLTVVFVVLIIEGIKTAKEQGKPESTT